MVVQHGRGGICSDFLLGEWSGLSGIVICISFSQPICRELTYDDKAEYKTASPCNPMELPQTLLEPILIRRATLSGFVCRFNTEFVSFREDEVDGFVDVVVRDRIFGSQYTIRCTYLFGADGARGKIVSQLGLPLRIQPGGGMAWNVMVRADLSHLMKHRPGMLHWIYQHDIPYADFAWIGFARMVKPWHEWVFNCFPLPDYDSKFRPSNEDWLKRIRQMIGDDSVEVQIVKVSKWQINDVAAEQYSRGRVFCLGDAVHRHPPANGLGSNTCIQDAYNLAWKIAYVLKGRSAFQCGWIFITVDADVKR
jgi:2-polyprenyl-6-methoxyphenol hydroxylase-like FAD-dependent oxidoreductase